MKRETLKLTIKRCYEPNRLAKANVVNAYEALCPDKKLAIVDRSQVDVMLSTNEKENSKRRQS